MIDTVASVFKKTEEIRTYAPDPAWVLPSTMIGLELEIEGSKLNPVTNSPLWKQVEDNSLRVVKGCMPFEITFSMPLCGVDLSNALNVLEVGLNTIPPITWSKRSSTHVHLDVRHFKLWQLLKLIIYHTIFEPVLFRYAGLHRVDNIFCLPSYRAEGRIFENVSVQTITTAEDLISLTDNSYRYSALNFSSLHKFGTLEFRHLEGTGDVTKIRNWINIIMCLKKAAMVKDDIKLKELPFTFSQKGFEIVAKEIFGKYVSLLYYPEFQMDMTQGIRQAQDIIYRDNLCQISDWINTKFKSEGHSEGIKKYFSKKNKSIPVKDTPKKLMDKESYFNNILFDDNF